jgi:3-hydroxyisobutyrate dehydrogenase-like beta-hydroxyacid dehydrogenase
MPAQPNIGFIGLGNMGGRITQRLVGAGYDVIGFDVAPGRAQACGARPAGTIAELTKASRVLLLSLPDSKVIEAVMHDPGGILASIGPGTIVIDLSTAAPRSTVALSAELAARDAVLIDAGISGGAAAAAKGTLTIMLGCTAEQLARIEWVFAPFATKLVPMGAVGSGHAVKLLNNFLNAVALSATAEVMVAAKRAGLDLDATLDVLNASSGVNFATLNRFPHIAHGDYLEGGLTGHLMTKDLTLYLEYVSELGVPSVNVAGPLAAFGLGYNLGYADQISNRVVDAIGDLAGGVRLSEAGPATREAG